jgi:trans-aconitate methyltransferase
MQKKWDPERYQSRHSYVWEHGESLIELLAPQPGECILDLGCGSGQLTARIASSGAAVIGLDRSAEMIAEARKNAPALEFRVADAANFEIEPRVDAVFSNAALHWMKDAAAVVSCIGRALKPAGRFVAELGGHGNIRGVVEAVREATGKAENPWYYPTVGEYATLLEQHGFEVRLATLFDRPTRVEGEDGMEHWLVTFGDLLFSHLDDAGRREARQAIAERLRPKMYRDGAWIVDYRRLRVVAVLPS